ncbi:hypothetical protein [Nevskia sp.]|uniref:hypothetical protein n=1 Tax=Nevskia sp. TaxID=1929292 RepID=UPI003F7090D6
MPLDAMLPTMADTLRVELFAATVGVPMMLAPDAHRILLNGSAVRQAALSAVDDRYLLQPNGTAVVAITGTLLNRPTRASA